MIPLRIVERARTFAVGAELVLEKQDLKEICLSALWIEQRGFFMVPWWLGLAADALDR